MENDFRLTPELLVQFDLSLTPEKKYHYPDTDVYYNSHHSRRLTLFPGGWRGFGLEETVMGGDRFVPIFHGKVESEEEFLLALRFVGWVDHLGKVSGVDYLDTLPPLN